MALKHNLQKYFDEFEFVSALLTQISWTIPAKQRGTGHIQEMDLIFEKEL